MTRFAVRFAVPKCIGRVHCACLAEDPCLLDLYLPLPATQGWEGWRVIEVDRFFVVALLPRYLHWVVAPKLKGAIKLKESDQAWLAVGLTGTLGSDWSKTNECGSSLINPTHDLLSLTSTLPSSKLLLHRYKSKLKLSHLCSGRSGRRRRHLDWKREAE